MKDIAGHGAASRKVGKRRRGAAVGRADFERLSTAPRFDSFELC